MFCADDGARVTSASGPQSSGNVILDQQKWIDQAVREASGDLFANLSACRVVNRLKVYYCTVGQTTFFSAVAKKKT